MTDATLFPAPPGGPAPADHLLVGSIDLHHHGYPEFTSRYKPRLDDADELAICRAAGMQGIVLKSHMWPTVGRAYLLRRLVPGIDVYPSLTLNTVVGGFNPITVQSAADQGARVLFMPTWSATHDLERGGVNRFLAKYVPEIGKLIPERGLRVLDERGRVLPEVRECLAIAGEHRMMVATGHISPRESIAIAGACKDYNIPQVLFAHPESRSVGATKEEIRDMLQLGGVYEFCVNGFMPGIQRMSPAQALEIVALAGPDKTVITTDSFYDSEPPGPEMMRILIATFLRLGLAEADIRKMVCDTPRRLLNLDEVQQGTRAS